MGSERSSALHVGGSWETSYGQRTTDLIRVPTRSRIPYVYVDSNAALAALVARMKGAARLALDTEADSLHHYFEKVCLIQLTVSGEHYIFRGS